MSDLSPDQQSQLRIILQDRLEQILARAQEGLEFSRSRTERDSGRDSLDESTEEGLLSTELRLRDREKMLLEKIRQAQERLESGTINECEGCGGPIGFKRLAARPVTTLCIACKEQREALETALGEARSRRSTEVKPGAE